MIIKKIKTFRMQGGISQIGVLKFAVLIIAAVMSLGMTQQAAAATEVINVCSHQANNYYNILGDNAVHVREKLDNPVNFGPAGTYGDFDFEYIDVGDNFTEATILSNSCNIWYSGYEFDSTYTATELTELQNWVNNNNGQVIAGCDDSNFDPVCSLLDFSVTNDSDSYGFVVAQIVNPITCSGELTPGDELNMAGGAGAYFSGTAVTADNVLAVHETGGVADATKPILVYTGNFFLTTDINMIGRGDTELTTSLGPDVINNNDIMVVNAFSALADVSIGDDICTSAEPISLSKTIVSGPDIGLDGEIDLVVEVGQYQTTAYDFEIDYKNSDEVPVFIKDTLPAEWDVKGLSGDMTGLPLACGGATNFGDGTGGNVDLYRGGKVGKKCQSSTKIGWTPDPAGGTINVWAETRGHSKNGKFKPTSCGALMLNNGAAAYELDPVTGEPLDQPPILESNQLCLAAVSDVNEDGMITRDGSGDEDGDGLSDFGEACESFTDPCVADTDGDGVIDGLDECPLEGPANASLGQILDANGCIRQSQCSDGIDNDNDGPIDFAGGDLSCDDIIDDSEDTNDSATAEVCDIGTTGVISGDNYVVCRVSASDAWVSANNAGSYDARVACQALGFTDVVQYGGTCGNVCGYCETAVTSCTSPGAEIYDGNGGANFPTLAVTVNWRCE